MLLCHLLFFERLLICFNLGLKKQGNLRSLCFLL